ncbi:hypothetical protein E2C01_030995 [Portunus trituberculatus]|uniref:Uncharacterized protein n=1 Tax=Portunus trituberculatus TaxID=210409 RepID=A0A5B7EYW4_PORTR|nr:hypothetical protein [Portunus trituberculatus]
METTGGASPRGYSRQGVAWLLPRDQSTNLNESHIDPLPLGQVRTAVRKYVDNYLLHRSAGVRRGSGLSSVFLTTVTDLPRDHHGRARHLCSCLRGSQSPTHG